MPFETEHNTRPQLITEASDFQRRLSSEINRISSSLIAVGTLGSLGFATVELLAWDTVWREAQTLNNLGIDTKNKDFLPKQDVV